MKATIRYGYLGWAGILQIKSHFFTKFEENTFLVQTGGICIYKLLHYLNEHKIFRKNLNTKKHSTYLNFILKLISIINFYYSDSLRKLIITNKFRRINTKSSHY